MPKKKRFSDANRQEADFTFLIYTPKNIYLKNFLFLMPIYKKNSKNANNCRSENF